MMGSIRDHIRPGAHIHLMGICGTAMASLAGILKDLGYRITGSDQNVYPPMSTQLAKLGIPIMEGYRASNLEPRPDLVIVGNVITREFEETKALLASNIPYTSLPKAMGEFVIAHRHSVVVAGTHGKTTTTALATFVADQCGLKPGFLIGGIPLNYERSFRAPEGDWFVIEGDEYDTAFFDKVPKFIHYRPRSVILTSLEFDHADIYKNIDDIKNVFQKLTAMIPEDGLLVCHADEANVMEVAKFARCRVVTYGLKSGDYRAVERGLFVGRNQFAVEKNGEKIADLALKVFGPHNTLNALSVSTLARELKWPEAKVLQAMAGFQGVKRRQEIIGEPRGITVIEDFAHHPTAVALTLESLRERYPDRRIHAVFEPRSATSRRSVFQKEYAKAFSGANFVYLAQPFNQERIPVDERFSSDRLAGDLAVTGVNAQTFSRVDDIVSALAANAQPKDVIIVMSNGGFDGIYGKLLAALA